MDREKKEHSADALLAQLERNKKLNESQEENPYAKYGDLLDETAKESPDASGDKTDTKNREASVPARKSGRKIPKNGITTKDCVKYTLFFTPDEYVRLDVAAAHYGEQNGRITKPAFIKKMMEVGLKKTDPELYEIYKHGLKKS